MRCLSAVCVIAPLAAIAAQPQDGRVLLQRHDCYLCHADRDAKTGPAFVDVAVKYRRNPRAEAILMAVVKGGAHGGGPWPMPPMPQVSDSDARQIVAYILSLP
jgi:cytochrome c